MVVSRLPRSQESILERPGCYRPGRSALSLLRGLRLIPFPVPPTIHRRPHLISHTCIIPLTMPSERVQRRVDRLLDQAEEAVEALDWSRVREVAGSILVVDPDNDDARSFLAMAEHNLVDAPLRTRRRLLPLTQAPQFLPRRLPVRPHSRRG